MSWPARGTHATRTIDGLARRLFPVDGFAGRMFAVRAENSSDRPPAVTVTSPALLAVTGGAAPDAVSVSGPLREMAVAGDLRPRQVAVACLVASVTLVLRFAVTVTAAAFGRATSAILARGRAMAIPVSRARSVTAARGRVTVIPVPVGWIGWPAVPATGKVAVTSALTGRDAEGSLSVTGVRTGRDAEGKAHV